MVRRYSEPESDEQWAGGGKSVINDNPLRDVELPYTLNPLQNARDLIDRLTGTERRIAPTRRGSNLPSGLGKDYGTMGETPNKGMSRFSQQRGMRGGGNAPMPGMPGYDGGTFADYLAKAMSLVGGGGDGGAGAVDNRIAAAKSANAEGNARINALYNALTQSFRDEAPGIQENTGQAIDASREQTDLSQAGMEAARNASRSAEEANLDEIGIGDSALLAAGRGRADSDLQQSVGNLQNTAVSQAGLLQQQGGADLGLNQTMVRGSGLRGAEMQVQNERTLQNMLAGLEDERYAAQQQAAQQGQQSRMQALGLAQDMADQDYGRWQDQTALEMDLDDRAYNRALDSQPQGVDLGQMELLLENIPEGSPARNMLISQLMGMSPMLYEQLSQTKAPSMQGLPKGMPEGNWLTKQRRIG